ncbi:MAG TPA: hypothetical protein VGM44_00545 [Polyangiaceae bacterium]|jgi:hypothetical protein
MLPRFRERTAPGGVLVFTSGTTEGGKVGGDRFGDRLYHGSLDTEEYARLLKELDYAVVLHRIQDPSWDRTVWLARLQDQPIPNED